LRLIVYIGHTHPRERSARGCCTITYMPKTRDFFILIGSCVCVTIVAGLFLSSSPAPEYVEAVQNPALFLEPRDAYSLKPYREDTVHDTRDSFIEKVRRTYTPPTPKSEPIVSEELFVMEQNDISVPQISTVSTTTASTTYGDTSL